MKKGLHCRCSVGVLVPKTLMFAALIILASSAMAHASSGSAWLARIDQTARLAQAHLVLDVTVTDARGRERARTIEVWQQGDERRLVRLTAPARIAGIGLLVSPGGQTHLFLPSYPPARRVTGPKRSDAFMGTDFAIEDLSRMTYSGTYTATVNGEVDGLTHLILSNVADSGAASPHLWVDAEAVVRRIQHFDDQGQPSRTLLLSDVRDVGDAQIPHEIQVTDLKRNRITRAKLEQIDVSSDIDTSTFSVTQLERR